MSNVSVLRARDLVNVYGDRIVLDGVSLSAGPGQRLGLVGENGIGKSTLLRLLSGAEEPDGGEVQRPADTEFLRQELPFPADAPLSAVVDALVLASYQRHFGFVPETLLAEPPVAPSGGGVRVE